MILVIFLDMNINIVDALNEFKYSLDVIQVVIFLLYKI